MKINEKTAFVLFWIVAIIKIVILYFLFQGLFNLFGFEIENGFTLAVSTGIVCLSYSATNYITLFYMIRKSEEK